MGFINRIVANGASQRETRQYCAIIADNAPMTMHALKRTVAELAKRDHADFVTCDDLVQGSFDSQDYSEGRRALWASAAPSSVAAEAR